MNEYEIIVRPHITEKSTDAAAQLPADNTADIYADGLL